jgi:hypothetical protein
MSKLFLLNNSKSILLFPNGFSFFKKEISGNILEKTHSNTSVSFLPLFAKDYFVLENPETDKIDIIYDLFPPILIPKVLYDESTANEALGSQFEISEGGQMKVEEMETYNAAYFINPNELNAIQKISNAPCFTHLDSLIFQNLKDHSFYKSDNSLALSINDSYADYILIKSQKVHLVNRFNFTSEYDILYYLLNLFKQYGIKVDNCQIIFFQNKSTKINEIVSKYFQTCECIV